VYTRPKRMKKKLAHAIRAARKDDGWTFIETLIVLGIILILTATVGFTAVRYLQKAKVVAARSQIDTIELALQAYYLDCGAFPTQEQGLEALWSKPTTSPVPDRWNGPYVAKRIPKDPWGNAYVYKKPGPDGLPYGIAALGEDGLEGGDDENADIASWE